MLDTELKDQLKLHLDYLPRPIEITAALDDGADSGALRSLLDDIASASDKIRIVELKGPIPGVREGTTSAGPPSPFIRRGSSRASASPACPSARMTIDVTPAVPRQNSS